VEAVVEQRLGAQRLMVSAFQTWWNDLVVTVPVGSADSGVFTYANASRVNSYGVNAGLEGSAAAQRLRYGGALTWAHTQQDARGGETTLLPAAAQVFGNARVSYDLAGRLPVLGLALRFAAARPVSGSSLSPVPEAGRQVEVLGAVTGPLRGGFSYRVSGSWALSGVAPYAAGPSQSEPGVANAAQAVLPLPRYQVLLGLRYDR
jgi:hypothetical protein